MPRCVRTSPIRQIVLLWRVAVAVMHLVARCCRRGALVGGGGGGMCGSAVNVSERVVVTHCCRRGASGGCGWRRDVWQRHECVRACRCGALLSPWCIWWCGSLRCMWWVALWCIWWCGWRRDVWQRHECVMACRCGALLSRRHISFTRRLCSMRPEVRRRSTHRAWHRRSTGRSRGPGGSGWPGWPLR
jgi:hypothetical protein